MLLDRIWIAICRVILGCFTLAILGGSYFAKFPEFIYLPWALRGARNLPAPSELGNDLRSRYIAERLAEQFPIGSTESKLTRSLWISGFSTPMTYSNDPNGRVYASLKGGLAVCSFDWTVSWVAEGGIIKRIDGSYSESCL